MEEFDDVKVIQEHLNSFGVTFTKEIDTNTCGPAHITLTDSDGNFYFEKFTKMIFSK